MEQEPLTQRVKFLSEALAESVRSFGISLGEKQTTTSNYITGRNKPSSDFLEKIVIRFRNVSAHWLLTGEGEPFLSTPTENTQLTANAQKFFRSQIIGSNQGTANQQQNTTGGAEKLETELALARQQVEHLQQQLAAKDVIIESKQELIDLLKQSK